MSRDQLFTGQAITWGMKWLHPYDYDGGHTYMRRTRHPVLEPAQRLTFERFLPDGQAACTETDPELWFPPKGIQPREALRICQGCELVDACLDYALTHRELDGVWGGTTMRERQQIRRGWRGDACD